MTSPKLPEMSSHIDQQRRDVMALRHAMYSQPDPTAHPDLANRLAEAQARLLELEHQLDVSSPDAGRCPENPPAGRLLGPESTGLKVDSALNMEPLPTGIYHLLDPETSPLLTVIVSNVSAE